MRVWLIKIAEPDPVEGVQLGRTGELAEYLSKNGHQVTWWKSTFHHGNKSFYFNKDTITKYGDNEVVVSMHSPIVYHKNISIARIVFYILLSFKFAKMAIREEKPDIILTSWPPISLTKAAMKYAQKRNIPVVIDVRDCWPDIFEKFMPKLLAKSLMPILKKNTRNVYSHAEGITSVQNTSLKWGCRYAGREPSKNDKAFYTGLRTFDIDEIKKAEILNWWKSIGVTDATWNLCFWGNLRHTGLDLDTCIKAVQMLESKYPDIRLIIGGEGDSKEELMRIAKDSSAVIFAGYLNGYQMSIAMSIAKLGVYSLVNTEDFIDTISNKAIQYMSGKLPVLNSLAGFTKHLLEEEYAGVSYKEGCIEDCARQIEYLYLNENIRKTMAENAYKIYMEQFYPDKINKDFEEYLMNIVLSYKNKKDQHP